jgi:lysophospholipase L1-like esterase
MHSKVAIANLEKNFALPAYQSSLKIMSLGDSITYGVIGTNDRDSGGYRTELWNKLVADGLKVEFVGSQSSGPDGLSNKNHEGIGNSS